MNSNDKYAYKYGDNIHYNYIEYEKNKNFNNNNFDDKMKNNNNYNEHGGELEKYEDVDDEVRDKVQRIISEFKNEEFNDYVNIKIVVKKDFNDEYYMKNQKVKKVPNDKFSKKKVYDDEEEELSWKEE